MKCNRQELHVRKGKKYAELMLIGDVHLGSPECDVPRFQRMVKYCADHERQVFLMGDIIEASTRYSVGGGVYAQGETTQGSIQLQYEYAMECLYPLSSKGLIVGFHNGNHEGRVYKETGFDISKVMCREMKVPYLGDAGWSHFKVGNESYTMYSLHGASGSRFVHTKLKALVDISHSFEADILSMGHVHACADTYQLVQRFDKRMKTLVERKKLLVITGHYLKYGGYGAARGFPIEKLGSPLLKLHSDKHDVHISW